MATIVIETKNTRNTGQAIAVVLAIWAGAVTAAAATGLLLHLPPVAMAGSVVAGVAGPTIAYFLVPNVRRWVEAVGLRGLTLFHGWRIVAAFLFFGYGAQGLLPERFVGNAAWGDLLAGLLALLVVAMPFTRSRYVFAHLFGLGDFVLAVGTGLYFTLTAPASIAALRELPLALIPLFGVGLSGATHLIAFDLLRRRAG